MFQSFDAPTSPEQGPPRIAALRKLLATRGIDGFIVPRADVHQGEYVADHDARLAWLTGFTGSAGFAIILPEIAGVFIDGRYRVQVKAQVALDSFTPVPWPETKPGDWIRTNLSRGRVAYDPWLHSRDEIDRITTALAGSEVTLEPTDNLVDAIWSDQPAPPLGRIDVQPEALAGETSAEKRARLAAALKEAGQKAAILTLADSISWLLNIRGHDIPRNPVVHALAILRDDGQLRLFVDDRKLDADLRKHLGPEISVEPPDAFAAALDSLEGPVRVDRASAPKAVSDRLAAAGVEIVWAPDPCILPKARKNPAEIAGTAEAHLRDGAAMCAFLAWLDAEAPKGTLTEIAVVSALEGFRRATNALRDISFDTICGAGPNGAIVHYRVTEGTDRPVKTGELLLVDSGGQYVDGTTDITRTVAVGQVGEPEKLAFTRVLQGMVAISRARWPRGLAGRDLDTLARMPLWLAGQDYDHGTGHGVGAFLCVHEGPQRISRISEVPLEPGMILSNEPGYYREGAFGIRTENLLAVVEAPPIPDGDDRAMLSFRTLTWVPIDRRLILRDMLSPEERFWIDAYHAEVLERIGERVSPETLDWLRRATAPL
ncbi:X-Pro aminopeptidase [Haematobacter missouriensis]|uniref:Xaa-Pro aminopeptidase n=1 Tax=Haematobacter missouriensis TaxID=366616 RepID=A0A212ASS4_9RHOB|nr:aminopeptidase P family protein [Haematobacter missouriensis]KFI32322.1 X-Pro aminopeptidase [Haematobacter missouriensis]OWJ75232.1 Xaa-Pro aminopeptidase [Haematobacter missouriensis]OWJ84532.1 Xaa-Pro aminopeptidase [Haematobacter missouriensis]